MLTAVHVMPEPQPGSNDVGTADSMVPFPDEVLFEPLSCRRNARPDVFLELVCDGPTNSGSSVVSRIRGLGIESARYSIHQLKLGNDIGLRGHQCNGKGDFSAALR